MGQASSRWRAWDGMELRAARDSMWTLPLFSAPATIVVNGAMSGSRGALIRLDVERFAIAPVVAEHAPVLDLPPRPRFPGFAPLAADKCDESSTS
jgi:hypothetical protein